MHIHGVVSDNIVSLALLFERAIIANGGGHYSFRKPKL